MRKIKKALASLAIAGMVLSMAPASIFAADDTSRLYGDDRYLTSIKVAEAAYSEATTAVVAAGNQENLVDALAAAPLAAQENAPIYLTNKVNMNDDVINSMMDLGVENVIVVGAAANKAVVDELKNVGFAVKELAGSNRVATAKAINAELEDVKGAFLVGHLAVADAMSVASYAAANNYAIVVAERDGSVPAGVSGIDYVVGGTAVVKSVAGADRLAGKDRWETNEKVIAELEFEFNKVYVANGLTLADALVGSVLAAQTNSPIALTDGKTVQADIASNLNSDSSVIALGGTAAVSNAVINAVKNPPSTPGSLAVESVAAKAANAFEVKFSKAPADTEKVAFEVKNAGTAMTTTVKWNDAKTVASLVYSANFPQGNYTVAVKDDAKELGSFEVKIEQQKVAKIEVTSDVLSVDIQSGTGYAVYRVFDQYGIDITNLPLAKNINWTVGIGKLNDAKTRDGLIVIEKGDSNIPLLSYPSCVISGIDSNNYVNVHATLSVSQASGTISKINLKELYSLNDDEFTTSNQATGTWYLGFEAFDASGNPTTNYELINAGVLDINGGGYVNARVVEDPKDNKKAAIEVKLDDIANNLTMDITVTITVILKNGQSAPFSTTLTLGARPDSITLYAPAKTVSSDERFIVPFVVYDQNGKEIKSYNKITAVDAINISVSGGASGKGIDGKGYEWLRNGDGSASLAVYAPTVNVGDKSKTVYVMATVGKTGKNSRVNVTVQEQAVPYSLSIDSSKLTQAMQKGATQDVQLGKALVIKDQYGRDFDIAAQSTNTYKVAVTANPDLKVTNVSAVGTDPFAPGSGVNGVLDNTNDKAKFEADATKDPGSKGVKFDLYKVDTVNVEGVPTPVINVIDSKNYSFTVVANDKITGYTLGELKTLYAVADDNAHLATLTAQEKAYVADLKVFGTLSNGNKVILANTVNGLVGGTSTVQHATVGSDFNVGPKGGNWANNTVTTVAAIKPGSDKTSASSVVTVVVNGTDGSIYPLTAKVESSTEKPVVQSIGYEADDSNNGRVTIASPTGELKLYVSKFNSGATASDEFHFYGTDQYGTKAGNIAVYLGNKELNTGGSVTISNNVLTIGSGTKGSITLTAVAGGVSETVTIDIVE